MNAPIADIADPGPVPLSRRPDLGALVALFVLALRQYAHGRKLLVLSLLFALPSVLAAAVNLARFATLGLRCTASGWQVQPA